MSKISFIAFLSLCPLLALAQSFEELQPIKVTSPAPVVQEKDITGGDSASLIKDNPAVSFQSGGGLSTRPALRGLTDDRINIKIDGATLQSACPNHMNPVMSYVDPSKIEEISVLPGITPVSEGGDSIGGTISIKTKKAKFSENGLKTTGSFNSFYKSNNENMGASLELSMAGKDYELGYSGFDEKANNYRKGGGDRLKSTLYNQNNQTVRLAKAFNNGIVSLKLNRAVVPYEGFINQRMDLTDNKSDSATLNYIGDFGNTAADFTFYLRDTKHEMDILPSERGGEMPMKTHAQDAGYSLKFVNTTLDNHALGFGHEYIQHKLHDTWPGLDGVTVIMGPDEFVSINKGSRNRTAFYAEVDTDWSSDFSTNMGVRYELVKMETGSVHGYNDMDNLPQDAAYFNSLDRSKTDHNIDVTLKGTHILTPTFEIEFGLARKTRSPNMYERFAWAGLVTDPTDPNDLESMSASMDMLMINWFGDGNGYVGDVNLKPEVAHKTSVSFIAHDRLNKDWLFSLTPFYSEVTNYIDANFLGTLNGNNYLQFANHDAKMFGVDLMLKTQINSHLTLSAVGNATRGYRRDGKADLYHVMPFNGSIRAVYAWEKVAINSGIVLVDKKKNVNELRNEPETPGYALLNLGTTLKLTKLATLSLQVENLLDKAYALPMGGIDLVNDASERNPVAGMGRSVNLAINIAI